VALDDRRRCLVALDSSAGDSLSVAWMPGLPDGGNAVAVGYIDGTVRIWDLNYFDRHIAGQLEYQSSLRAGATTTTTQAAP
jgi:hypothetical protein